LVAGGIAIILLVLAIIWLGYIRNIKSEGEINELFIDRLFLGFLLIAFIVLVAFILYVLLL
jgi:hypothetical protein